MEIQRKLNKKDHIKWRSYFRAKEIITQRRDNLQNEESFSVNFHLKGNSYPEYITSSVSFPQTIHFKGNDQIKLSVKKTYICARNLVQTNSVCLSEFKITNTGRFKFSSFRIANSSSITRYKVIFANMLCLDLTTTSLPYSKTP
jgi:DNA replication protein DnaD